MKFIELKNTTQFVSVDDEDYERIKMLNTEWTYNKTKTGHCILSTRRLKKAVARVNGIPILLHRFILDLHLVSSPLVDHKDRDIFNCRKTNLRTASASQNSCNRDKQSNNTSGYIGVCYRKDSNYWVFTVKKGNKIFRKGKYATAKEAAIARDIVVKQMHGEFSVLNFKEVSNAH